MNANEHSIRECAYQIWESEGRPVGHDFRHWEMACKLVEGRNNKDADIPGSAHVLSVIAPDEPQKSEPAPGSVPVEPIAPIENPPHISPTPSPQPIHPTDPTQPDNPAKPIQPYTSGKTSAAIKSALADDGVKPAPKKKPAKTPKTKASTKQDSINV